MVVNTLRLLAQGAVGFIPWLGELTCIIALELLAVELSCMIAPAGDWPLLHRLAHHKWNLPLGKAGKRCGQHADARWGAFPPTLDLAKQTPTSALVRVMSTAGSSTA